MIMPAPPCDHDECGPTRCRKEIKPTQGIPRDDAEMIANWVIRIQILATTIEQGRSEQGRLSKGDIQSSASEIEGITDCLLDLINTRLV